MPVVVMVIRVIRVLVIVDMVNMDGGVSGSCCNRSYETIMHKLPSYDFVLRYGYILVKISCRKLP